MVYIHSKLKKGQSMRRVIQNFQDTLAHKQPKQVPVVVWGSAPFLTRMAGIKEKEYYLNPQLKVQVQISFQRDFPDILMFPGIWADFGSVVEPSAFGCEVVWFEQDAPYVKPAVENVKDIAKLKLPDPEKSGLMPKALEQYTYMWDHVDKELIRDYGYLDGVAYCLGPIETSALIMGYDKFFIQLYDNPDLIHKLLNLVTEGLLIWLKAQQEINGEIKRLFVGDHMPTQLSSSHFEEFCLPYLSKIYQNFPRAVKLYHNEGNVSHILTRIPEIGADIFHFGIATKFNKVSPSLEDLKRAKRKIGEKICLMGNLDPLGELLNVDSEKVLALCKERIRYGAHGGGYFLSSGGGMAPGTPKENIQAMVEATSQIALDCGSDLIIFVNPYEISKSHTNK